MATVLAATRKYMKSQVVTFPPLLGDDGSKSPVILAFVVQHWTGGISLFCTALSVTTTGISSFGK